MKRIICSNASIWRDGTLYIVTHNGTYITADELREWVITNSEQPVKIVGDIEFIYDSIADADKFREKFC